MDRAEEPPVASAAPPTKGAWWTYGVLLAATLYLAYQIALPLWKALLVAAVLASTVGKLHQGLTRRLRGYRSISAAIFTFGVVALILVPLTFLGYVIVREAIEAVGWLRSTFQSGGVEGLIGKLPDTIESGVRRLAEYIPEDPSKLVKGITGGGTATAVGGILGAGSQMAFQLAMMLIAFYFLLTDGHRLLGWLAESSPLGPRRTNELVGDLRNTSRAVLISMTATAAAQAAVATVGYFIARVPQAAFFGFLTFLTAFIPSVGTAVVSVPLAGLLLLLGHKWAALFLVVWGVVIVGLVDNVVKPILIARSGGVRVDGIVVFFSLVGGIAFFGMIGLIAGPLVASFLVALVRLGQRDFRRRDAA